MSYVPGAVGAPPKSTVPDPLCVVPSSMTSFSRHAAGAACPANPTSRKSMQVGQELSPASDQLALIDTSAPGATVSVVPGTPLSSMLLTVSAPTVIGSGGAACVTSEKSSPTIATAAPNATSEATVRRRLRKAMSWGATCPFPAVSSAADARQSAFVANRLRTGAHAREPFVITTKAGLPQGTDAAGGIWISHRPTLARDSF